MDEGKFVRNVIVIIFWWSGFKFDRTDFVILLKVYILWCEILACFPLTTVERKRDQREVLLTTATAVKVVGGPVAEGDDACFALYDNKCKFIAQQIGRILTYENHWEILTPRYIYYMWFWKLIFKYWPYI